MPVRGLSKSVDEYMQAIIAMTLPNDDLVKNVWVELNRTTEGNFVARAVTRKGGPPGYMAFGDTSKKALLELAAVIITEYPIKNDEPIDLDIPINEIVSTETFKEWFAIKPEENDEPHNNG